MKTSLNWLKQYVEIPWEPTELARRLTLAGLESEGLSGLTPIPPGVVIAEIVVREPHPNADKLSVCQVSVGKPERLQVVCGAPNCAAGQKAVLATVGTVLQEGKIKKAKLRGIESSGMLCSARELGLNDDHSGIMILPADAPVGRPFADYLGADVIMDWEVTPNRPDWLSHLGIAREIAALTGNRASFHLPEIKAVPVADLPVESCAAVEVQAPDLCPRYIARVIRNVRIGPSPAWLCRMLEGVGLRPINNVVDITNYVMLECGQPLHAFNIEQLAGRKIVVRRAAAGEKITTLDGKEYTLTTENLLIADAEKGVALAGVMGGANSMIDEQTTTVLLESAAFLPRNIRATSKKLGLATDSSRRFERGISLEMTELASARAAALICELGGGELLKGKIDVFSGMPPPRRIACRFERVNRLLGVTLKPLDITAYLERLGIIILSRNDAEALVEIPEYRLDLGTEVDLIEEVERLFGLDQIPEAPVTAQLGGMRSIDTYYPLEEAREQLLGLGLDEIINYSLLPAETACRRTGAAPENLLVLANPISAESAAMRPSLLPGMLQTVAFNLAHNNQDLCIFEIGRVIIHAASLPEERWQAGICLTGRVHPEQFGGEKAQLYQFADLKGIVESWFDARRVAGTICVPAVFPAFVPGCAAEIRSGDQTLAMIGEVVPDLTQGMRLKTPLYIALVELGALMQLAPVPRRYQPLPLYPATIRDISLVAPEELPCQAVIDSLTGAGCAWLERVELFDLFADENVLGAGRRSLAFSLTYRHPDRTLTDDEVNQAHDKVKAHLVATLAIQFR